MIDAYDSVVVRTACKLLAPFVQVFALYVLFHGHESPGGGFQGGAILGASVILLRFTQEREVALALTILKTGETLTVKGTLPLVMTDYGITPPKAMLGMLKTDPKVTIAFETAFSVPTT